MKLKTIALAAIALLSTQLAAQTLKVETGKQQKIAAYSHTNIYYINDDGALTAIYANGSSNSVNALDRVSIVTYDDKLNPSVNSFDGEKKTGKTLRSCGMGHFNDKILLFGVGKDDSKKWNYSIFTLDEKGNLTGSEIKLNFEFKAQLSVSSIFSTCGFVKSPNNKYGAMYVCHSSDNKSAIFVSAIVFDKDMNVISNISTQMPEYDKGAVIDKAFIDDDGNLIGSLREGTVSLLSVVPNTTKAEHGLYAFIAKKGATEMTYVKVPSGKKVFQTLDMESAADGDYRIFGIYKKPTTGHAIIDGAASYLINTDGDVEAGPEVKNPDKFNIFSKSTIEARLTTFAYRVLPSIVTADNSTVFIVQKTNFAGSFSHYMDVYMFKFSDKGLEWEVRIPAYTTNFCDFSALYDKASDKLSLVYCQKAGHKFTSETELTPLDDNNSGMANFYVTEVDKDGNIETTVETTEKYQYPFANFKVGKTIYERVIMGIYDEKLRKVEIE